MLMVHQHSCYATHGVMIGSWYTIELGRCVRYNKKEIYMRPSKAHSWILDVPMLQPCRSHTACLKMVIHWLHKPFRGVMNFPCHIISSKSHTLVQPHWAEVTSETT